MSTLDFFRLRLDQMIDLRHTLAALSTRLPSCLNRGGHRAQRFPLGHACQACHRYRCLGRV